MSIPVSPVAYEYKTFPVSRGLFQKDWDVLDRVINELAESGWEIVSFSSNCYSNRAPFFNPYLVICRRPLTPAQLNPGLYEWAQELESFRCFVPKGHILGSCTAWELDFFNENGYAYTGIEENKNLQADTFDGYWNKEFFAQVPPYKITVLLQQIHNVMKNGAYGFFTVYLGQEDFIDPLTNKHYYLYSEQTIERILQENGFIIEQRGKHKKLKEKRPFNVATYLVRAAKY